MLRETATPRLWDYGYDALQLPCDAAVLVSGQPGGGKSTMCSVMATALASAGRRVLWLSPEEGRAPTTAQRFGRILSWFDIKPDLSTLMISDARSLRDAHEEVAAFETGGGDIVVVDSLTVLGASNEWWADLCRSSLGAIAIVHQNSKGGPMGGARVAYDCDVHLSVANFVVEIRKTRWLNEHAPRCWRVDDTSRSGEVASPRPNVVPFPSNEEDGQN